MKKRYVIGLILLAVLISLMLVRNLSSRQLDDVSPGIECDTELLANSDVLFIIPKFENKSISENRTWCEEILKLNKTLEMHGVYHSYEEFNEDRSEEYLLDGMNIFYECFGVYPLEFKAPQLVINSYNKRLVREKMKFVGYFNQLFHKVYHCGDSGQLSNRFIDWI